jgi:hypothetical protein
MSNGGFRDRFLKPAILIFAIFLGCGFLWLGLSSILLVNESSGWPTTDGYVTESYITHPGRGGQLVFRYDYEVDGLQYHSHTISYSFDGPLVYFAEKYPQGTYVQVHYDPNDPTRAVLEHDFNFMPSIFPTLVGGVFLTGCSLAIAIMSLRWYRNRSVSSYQQDEREQK